MIIKDIKKSEIRDYCNESKILACRIIDIKFDISKLQNDVSLILKEHAAISKDKLSTYKALGLQYINKNNPYYDCIESTRYINKNHISKIESKSFSDWHCWNDLGQKLDYLYIPLSDIEIDLYRTRLLIAEPGCTSVTHIDYDYRYHIAITSNENCFLVYDNEKFYIPVDGHPYIINAGYMHSYYNNGDTNRTHYCGIMSLPCKGDGQFLEALQNGNKKELDYVYT